MLAVGGNAALWGYETYRVGIHTDLASSLTFAYLGVHSGWSHLCDWHLITPLLHIYGARYWPN